MADPIFDYSLGYAATDGCLTEAPSGIPRILWLSTERDIIEKLHKALGTPSVTVSKPRRGKEKPVWRTDKTGSQFCQPYLDAGLVRRKTYGLGPLRYTEFGDLLRGILDGDGHISNNFPYLLVTLVSSAPKFLDWMEEETKGRDWTPSRYYYERKDRRGAWGTLAWTGERALRLIREAYDRTGIRLERKGEQAKRILRADARGDLRYARDPLLCQD